MRNERFKIEFRKRQLVYEGNDVIVQCTPSGRAEYVLGTITPNPWVEMTDYTEGLGKLNLSWSANNTAQNSAQSQTNQAGSNYDKGISLDLIFRDKAYEFIYDWLVAGLCGTINSVEVRLTDLLYGIQYRTFEIKADNLSYEPYEAPCEFEVKLREFDGVWHCVHKTVIFDNHQNWFIDGSSKQHPCFLTCVEPRPRLIASARMGLSIFARTIPVFSAIFNENDDAFRRILNCDNFVDSPLVRDYIKNVADKCGLLVDTMFDNDVSNPYRNLCIFYPGTGQWHINDGSSVTSPALWYHFENRWLITLSDFLDKLKIPFNAEWYVTPGATILFKPKSYFQSLAPIYDFTAPGAIEFHGLRYTFNGEKKPAYGRYAYQIDGSDLATQEILPLYNDIVDYDGPANNPMLEGERSKNIEFAATAFVKDGRARSNYMRDLCNDGETVAYGLVVLLAVVVAALFAGVLSAGAAAALAAFLAIWVVSIANKANDLRDNFDSDTYWGAVRLTSDQVAQPRLLLWNGESMNRAKVVSVDAADIDPNEDYNPDLDGYDALNTFYYPKAGVYNYPLYFDSKFKDNLYDRFHDALDNPLFSLESHQDFQLFVDLCEEAITLFGLNDGNFARIGYLVKLEERDDYEVFGRIQHIETQYDNERIILKGKVLRKKL